MLIMKNKIKTQLTKILSLGLIPLGIATIPTVISTSLTQLQAVQLDSIITNPALGQLNTTTLNDDQMKNVIKLKLADTFTTLKTNAISISALTSTTYTATSIDTNIYTGSVNGTYSTLAAPTDTIASHLGIANDGVYDITYGIGAASGTTGYLQTPIFPLLGTDLPSASDVLKLVNTNVYTSDADTPMNINQIQCVSPSDFSTPITDPI
jgi:hypothetical protein